MQEHDRSTIVIQASHQEWDPAELTHVRAGWDSVSDRSCLPSQVTHKIGPGERVELELGDAEPNNRQILLYHKNVFIPKSEDQEVFAKAQKDNTMRITDEAGNEICWSRPKEMSVLRYSGKLFAKTTHTSAMLQVTVFPG